MGWWEIASGALHQGGSMGFEVPYLANVIKDPEGQQNHSPSKLL